MKIYEQPLGFLKTSSVFKGGPCLKKQIRQFNHCSQLCKDARIRILICLSKVGPGSSLVSLILSLIPCIDSFSIWPTAEQPDRVEVIRLSGGGGDQCHSGSHGPDSAWRQSAKRS